jgi:hypothetical protein
MLPTPSTSKVLMSYLLTDLACLAIAAHPPLIKKEEQPFWTSMRHESNIVLFISSNHIRWRCNATTFAKLHFHTQKRIPTHHRHIPIVR